MEIIKWVSSNQIFYKKICGFKTWQIFANLNFKNENFHFLHFFGSHIAKIFQKKKSLVVMFYNNKKNYVCCCFVYKMHNWCFFVMKNTNICGPWTHSYLKFFKYETIVYNGLNKHLLWKHTNLEFARFLFHQHLEFQSLNLFQ